MTYTEALFITLFLGLGTARMAAIVSIDKIAEPIRDLIFHWYPPEDNERQGWFYQSFRKATPDEQAAMESWDIPWWQKRWTVADRLRKPHFLGDLISCHRCTSVWIAAGNLALWYVWQDAAYVLNAAMAISFVASAADTHFYKR